MFPQHVNQLHPDGVAERFGHFGHTCSLSALDVGVDDGLAAALACGTLLLGDKFQIDSHQYTFID